MPSTFFLLHYCPNILSVIQCKEDDAVGIAMDFIAVALSLVLHMQVHARGDEWFGGFVTVQNHPSEMDYIISTPLHIREAELLKKSTEDLSQIKN